MPWCNQIIKRASCLHKVAFKIEKSIESAIVTLSMEEMLAGTQDDEIFASTGQEPLPTGTSNVDQMLGDGDDDLFDAPVTQETPAQTTEVATSSAVTEWERSKKDEIAELDRKNNSADEELRSEARDKLDKFNETVRQAQEKREQHNKELEEQFLAEQKSEGKSWEKVVGYIDFNRTDLHERDVSKMKTLLLQLKH